jgi:Glutathione S-transferase, N-terminal domain
MASSSNTYRLHYFDGRGRAEMIRLIFVQAGQKFEDVRFTFDEWPALKSQMPLGQAPVLGILILFLFAFVVLLFLLSNIRGEW